MSLFANAMVACPGCTKPVEFEVVFSVNADRRPDLRDAIVKGSFQRETCPQCGYTFRMEPEFTYLDVGRKQWILVQPVSALPCWHELEEHAKKLFADAFGPKAPRSVRETGKVMTPRITFGWGALREKILCAEKGLDDVTVELVKTALARGLDNSPMADNTELRLVAVEDGELVFAWIEAARETVVETLRTPRALYEEIAADQKAWAALRQEMSAGPFVDLNRLLVKAA